MLQNDAFLPEEFEVILTRSSLTSVVILLLYFYRMFSRLRRMVASTRWAGCSAGATVFSCCFRWTSCTTTLCGVRAPRAVARRATRTAGWSFRSGWRTISRRTQYAALDGVVD